MPKNYQFDGEKYESSSAPQREWGTKLISKLKLRGNEIILDLGCGNGLTTYELANKVPNGKVIGIDSSNSMIEIAKSHKTDNMEFILMDMEFMDFENDFDVVFSNAALHWILNHENLLKNIYNSLKPHGFVQVQFAGDGNCPHFMKIVKEVMKLPKFTKYFQDFIWPWYMPKKSEYTHIIAKKGFKNYRIWLEKVEQYFQDEQSLAGWIQQPSIVPFVSILPEKLKNHFKDLVTEKMLQETKTTDGKYIEIFRRINVYAEKSK
jgi:trans-aconitate 2-methyltransferase